MLAPSSVSRPASRKTNEQVSNETRTLRPLRWRRGRLSGQHFRKRPYGSRTWLKNPPPRLRPRPFAHRSGVSLGARERGLARAAWVGGAPHPRGQPLHVVKKKIQRAGLKFCELPLCTSLYRLQRPRATSFVSFSQPTSKASYKVSF